MSDHAAKVGAAIGSIMPPSSIERVETVTAQIDGHPVLRVLIGLRVKIKDRVKWAIVRAVKVAVGYDGPRIIVTFREVTNSDIRHESWDDED